MHGQEFCQAVQQERQEWRELLCLQVNSCAGGGSGEKQTTRPDERL
jgi:hypothetical protein